MSRLADRQLARLRETDDEIDAALSEDSGLRERVRAVLGASDALGDHLVANPGLWRALAPGASTDMDEFDAATDRDSLRSAYRRRLLQISADDLTGDGDIRTVAARLSDLADATLEAALRIAREQNPAEHDTARLAIIAMGKCGARELNYVSDVDVLFVAEGDLTVATSWAVATMTLCGEVAWPVDAGLRPEGRSGALVRTVDSYVAYYEKWAKTWEFQALLKARPAAGDIELGDEWLEVASPLIWQTVESSGVVDEIRVMRRRVVSALSGPDTENEIKLGPGGLRDIEFAVQLMQLVHGRSDSKLRVTSTMDALDALTDGGYLARTDGESLRDSYQFLRTVEHRLQLQKLRRTHRMPDDAPSRHWLARVMGYTGSDELRADWRRHASATRRLHEKLFYRPLLEAVAEVPAAGLRLTPDAARARLVALGFEDPAGALRHISALIAGVSRTAAIQRTLLPVLLGEFASAPEPDRGLLAYRKVSEKLGRTPWYLRLLRDGGPIAIRLARILATSRYATDLLMRDPAALRLLANDEDLRPQTPRVLLDGMAAAADRHRSDPDAAISAVRAIRRRELLRIAFADLRGLLDVGQVGTALSDVTDAVLHTGLTIARRDLGDGPSMAIIGLGRLGGRENSYASDADVLFVYDGESSEAGMATAIVDRLRALLVARGAEPPLKVDVDLRPEGRQGPIVRSLSAYRRYYERWSSGWEAQALLRARHCAGDASLGARFLEAIAPVRYPEEGLSGEQLVELRRIKARVDTERLPRGADRLTHVKLGPGGLTDVEWSVQLTQLQNAARLTSLRTTSTMAALEHARTNELLTATDHEYLTESWLLASAIRNALTLARGAASDQLPRYGSELAAILAVLRRPDDEDPGSFVDEYLRAARHAHGVAERVFYGD